MKSPKEILRAHLANNQVNGVLEELKEAEREKMRKLGRKGGRATKKKYPANYYRRIGKLGGRPRRKRR